MTLRGGHLSGIGGRRRARRLLPHALIFLVVAGFYLSGGLNFIEDRLSDQKFRLIDGQASGDVVVVGIDPKSISQIGTWPWPRGLHGEAVTRLFEAGARQLAFDVDFSSLSVPEEDQWLEDAMAMQSGKIILPVFKQVSRSSSHQTYISFTIPHDRFRQHAEVASINVRPDTDGIVRQHTVRESWGKRTVPTMPALLSGADAIDTFGGNRFFIDFSIDPASVPVIPYVDVLTGRFDADLVRGKTVMIGAMAAEIGDHLPVPVYRTLPGVLVSALAAESLSQGRALMTAPPIAVLGVTLLLALLMGPKFRTWSWRGGLAGVGAVGLGALGVSLVTQAVLPITLDVVPLMLMTGLSFSYAALRQIDQQALSIFFANQAAHHHRSVARIISENSSDAVLLVKENGQIESFNQTAERIFDVPARDAIGRHVSFLFSGKRFAAKPTVRGTEKRIFTLGLQEGIGLRGNGSRFNVEYVAVPLDGADGGTPEYHILTVRDITARKREEHKIREMNRELEKKVQKRTQALRLALKHAEKARDEARDAQDRAEAADKIKSNFLANMSHELRTPLNAISGFSDALLRGFVGEVENQQHKTYISHIQKAANILMEMIDDLLDVSSIQGKDIELSEQRLDISTLTRYVVALSQKRAYERQIKLVNAIGDDMPILIGDDARIKTALSNVLDHAIRKSPEQGEVSLRYEWPEGGGLRLLVSDHGPELTDDELGSIFSNDTVLGADATLANKDHKLGMNAARTLIEAHDGTFTINSVPGQGNTVVMELPKQRISH